MENSDHLLSIAEIAGVFIGFSSLISLSPERSRGIHYELRAIVTIGLLVLVAALLPVWLSSYALSETPSFADAHYMTALVVTLFEAAFIFARIVYKDPERRT